MSEKPIISSAVDEALVHSLYETAFPVNEQIPWDELLRLVAILPLDVTAYYDSEGRFVGFTIVYPRKAFDWLWYFAVCPEHRGKGLGQRILSKLLGRYGRRTLIIDMESPEQVCDNAEQRHRRHGFYQRNGFRDTGVGRSFAGIDYTIMMRGKGTFTMRDYDEIIDELHAAWQLVRGNFAAIDFETANEQPSSVCSVGVVVVREGKVVDTFYSLIQPEPNYYKWFCQQVHGLGAADTDGAPVFGEVWARVAPLVEGLPLVAHNSPFDEGCLRAAHRVYRLDYPDYRFFDTLRASRRLLPQLHDHQLHTVSAACGYDLTRHHHALADAEACAAIATALATRTSITTDGEAYLFRKSKISVNRRSASARPVS